MKVYVKNMRGEPLMPTSPAKAQHLLDDGKAEVVERSPFTIQLNYATGENKQEVTLGVDAGYSKIGFSAVTEDEELISGEVELRSDISKKLEQRKNYRRTRRSRKTRYREPRFDNRSRPDGWLAPSIQWKYDAHFNLVEKLKKLLPITRTIVEVAKFDTQKMENPEITGKEYQQGALEGYHVREYLLEKFGNTCVYCGAQNVPLEIEHVVPKSRGGSNRVSNLVISCIDCNRDKNNQTAKEFGHPGIQKQAKNTLKAPAFMNTVRWKLVDELDCRHTYGYITKKRRLGQGLDKSHANDAFVIAGGNGQNRTGPLSVSFRRRNNRKLEMNRRSFGRSIRRKRYKIQPGDLLEKDGKIRESKGVFSYGRYAKINDSSKKYWNTENIKVVNYGQGFNFAV